VWDGPGFTPYPLAAHPRVDFFTLTRFKNSMIRMWKTPEGKKLLRDIYVNNGFETAKNSDWEEVDRIDLESLNGSPKILHINEPQ